jgi:hypothetical protein
MNKNALKLNSVNVRHGTPIPTDSNANWERQPMTIYRRIYEQHFGPIPKGHHIHHKDGNHSNNHIDNLQCVTAQEHFRLHYDQKDYGACWAMLRTGHIILSEEERSEISSNQMKYQWDNNREKMLKGRRERDDSCLVGRTWKLSEEKRAIVAAANITKFTSETADVCKNTIWVNDGNTNKRIKIDKEIPEGYTKGRLFTPWNKKEK